MSGPTHTKRSEDSGKESIPPLVNGDRLDQPTFHHRYEAMPKGTRAELIGGVVYLHSPAKWLKRLKRQHGRSSGWVIGWLLAYEEATPGTETYDKASNLMGPESEPQPDACLLISPAHGGQTSEKDEWIVGAPELIVEVALSSESLDLHSKKSDYEKAGVREYIVVALRQQRVHWFVKRDEVLTEVPGDSAGVYRSEVFPGLWLDGGALLRGDMARVRAMLAAGLATPEHTAFVARLQARAQDKTP